MITKAIQRAYDYAAKKGWDRIYICIDIHDTMIKANYKHGQIPTEFYPHAIEVLQHLTERPDVKLILYTCSHPHEIEEYTVLFKSHVLLDDKAGFQPHDWLGIKNYFKGV